MDLITRSIWLDKEFILSKYPDNKFEFIIKKYWLLIKHLIFKVSVRPGFTNINLDGDNIYYESKYGICNYQAMLVNFQKNYFPYLQYLKKPTIIDVGAHIGLFSLTCAKLFRKPAIYSCEPVGLAFELLDKNASKFNSINPVKTGFSSRTSKAPIYYLQNQLFVSSLFGERFDWGEKPLKELIKLETLDTFVKRKRISAIDILKIDTEGLEEEVLKGAVEALRRTRYLILEVSLYKAGASTFSSTIRQLYGPGYNFQLVNVQTPFLKAENRILTVDMLFENSYIAA